MFLLPLTALWLSLSEATLRTSSDSVPYTGPYQPPEALDCSTLTSRETLFDADLAMAGRVFTLQQGYVLNACAAVQAAPLGVAAVDGQAVQETNSEISAIGKNSRTETKKRINSQELFNNLFGNSGYEEKIEAKSPATFKHRTIATKRISSTEISNNTPLKKQKKHGNALIDLTVAELPKTHEVRKAQAVEPKVSIHWSVEAVHAFHEFETKDVGRIVIFGLTLITSESTIREYLRKFDINPSHVTVYKVLHTSTLIAVASLESLEEAIEAVVAIRHNPEDRIGADLAPSSFDLSDFFLSFNGIPTTRSKEFFDQFIIPILGVEPIFAAVADFGNNYKLIFASRQARALALQDLNVQHVQVPNDAWSL